MLTCVDVIVLFRVSFIVLEYFLLTICARFVVSQLGKCFWSHALLTLLIYGMAICWIENVMFAGPRYLISCYFFHFSMSSDTSSSSPNASNARPRRRGILGGLGRPVKLAKRPPQVNDSGGDESDECTDSDLCELSSSNETSDTTDAESSRYTLYISYVVMKVHLPL